MDPDETHEDFDYDLPEEGDDHMTERSVTVDREHELYLVVDEHGIAEHWHFDAVLTRIEAIANNLMLDAPRVTRGDLRTYDIMIAMEERLRQWCDLNGETAIAALTSQLTGNEGWYVAARRTTGEEARFIVGQSDGWMPHHVEITEGVPRRADEHYEYVERLRLVRPDLRAS